MKNVIDDITEFDSIYRSDGPGYVRFRKYFLKKFEKQLNTKFRENTYLPLRILLLETTRRKANHSLNDLWLLLHTRRMKAPTAILSISVSDSEIIPWHQTCTAINAPGPISDMHMTPYSRDRFAFSTLDGSIHFGSTNAGELRVTSSINIPGVSFLKFEWVNDMLLGGIGVTSSLFFLTSDSRVFEYPMSNPPSDLARVQSSPSLCVVGDRAGLVYSVDLSELTNQTHGCDNGSAFKQPTATTLSKIDLHAYKFHNTKSPITALAVPAYGDVVVCGTSDGNVDVVSVEQKVARGWRGQRAELKARAVQRLTMSKLNTQWRPASVDALAGVRTEKGDFLFVNLRSEWAALLFSDDDYRALSLVKSVRVPSMRARCPAAMSNVDGNYLFVAGTDMGDLIMAEEGEETTILTLHETTIAAVEWCGSQKRFIAADVSGLISLWTKNE